MRATSSASRERPIRTAAGVAGYTALVTLVIAFFTTGGFAAGVAGTLTIGLLVGSYLLERWARRRTVYATGSRPSPALADPEPTTSDGPRPAEIDESRMAKV